MNVAKIAQQPVRLALGAVAGLVAGAVVDRVWRSVSGADHVPQADEEDRGWGEILTAAALHGAVFAVVKAAVDRATATGARRLTGQWPG